ncbi:MAG: right-handed parallel beta-helix repeat-containing protein [Reyranellaceae bacterium]
MTPFSSRGRTPRVRAQVRYERRERWSRTRLMATTGLGGALAGLALGGGNAWGQVGPNTLPTGGQVVAGQATINQQNQSTLNVNQSSNKAIINWSSFDVGSDATVNFHQPNSGSWTVNRVTAGTSPSQVLGSVNANGNIAVINPNGVVFGQGSRVDANGLIATTSNISNQNFMSGNMKFDQPGNPSAMIVNRGDITVRDAGLVAFVAPGVSNAGTITANLGRVALASGNKFTVDLYGDNLVSIAVDGGTTAAPVGPDGQPANALVSNSGRIVADGGRVQMTAQQASAIVDNAINMSGVVRAQSAYVDKNGDIVLDAGPSGSVTVSGTLDVSGQQAGTKGGAVTVTGKNDVTLAATAKIDASGKAGGGTVKVGGGWQGKGATPTAKNTSIAKGAQISASAIDNGNGGTVVVWADGTTMFAGAIDARGGAQGGNGGMVEVSGKQTLGFGGFVDTRAPLGTTGTLLLDPTTVDIIDGANDTIATGGTITDGTLEALLGANNVTIATSTAGTGTGNGAITVHGGVSIDFATNSLTLIADDDGGSNIASGIITIQSGVTFANGSLELQAGTVNLGSELGVTILDAGANAAALVNVTGNAAGIVADAIDIVGSGGTVDLQATTYGEAILIDKSLTLTSTNGTAPTIGTPGAVAAGIDVFADDVTVSNLHIAPAGGSAYGVRINTGSDSVTIAGNTIDGGGSVTIGVFADGAVAAVVQDNVVTGFTQHGIQANNATGGFTASGNTISDASGLGANGIYLVSPTGSLVLSGNTIDDVANTGIQVDAPTGTSSDSIEISDNAIGGDTVNPIGGAGIIINGADTFLGTTTIAGNLVNVGGAAAGAVAISLRGLPAVIIDENTLTNIGSNGVQGIAIVGSTFAAGSYTISTAGSAGNTITGFTQNGIGVSDTDAFDPGTLTTVYFQGPNTISIPSGGFGLIVHGVGTAIGDDPATRSLGEMTFLRPDGSTGLFIALVDGALYSPDSPTVISAAGTRFDINSDGTIGTSEQELADFDPADIDTQGELDAFWGVGGIAANVALVEAAILDYNPPGSLVGRISVLGPGVAIIADDSGGLQSIQNAIDAAPAGGYVFVAAGVFGDPSPGGPGAPSPLTIDKSLFVYGRQAFASAADGTRTAGGADETVLDFAVVNADPSLAVETVGGILIASSDVTVRGFDIQADAVDESYGIRVDGDRAGIVIANNFIHGFDANGIDNAGGSIATATIGGNNIYQVGGSGIELSFADAGDVLVDGNLVRAGAGRGISLSSSSDTKPVTVSGNTVETAGQEGIAVGGFGLTIVEDNVVNSTLATDSIGADAIFVTGGGGGASRVSGNVIGGGVAGYEIAGSGIHFEGSTGSYSVASNTITSVGSTGTDNAGIRIVAGASDATFDLSGNAIDTVDDGAGAGDGISVLNANAATITANFTGNSIANVAGAGIRIVDDNPTLDEGFVVASFGAGNAIAGAATGLHFSGPDTRIAGQTLSDLVLGTSISPISGDFIVLENAALHGDPNDDPFNPLSYDASSVTFDGVAAIDLDPTDLADRQALADIENRIVHYLDTTLDDYELTGPETVRNMRGLIRVKADSFSLDDGGGLNAVQLAISGSVDNGTIYLLAGNYGDASNLLDTINDSLQGITIGTPGNDYLFIDRPLSLVGAQAGVSAATAPRNPFVAANESVLDFEGATSSGDGGVVIGASGVTIDGVAVVADADQPFGIRIDPNFGGPLSNITLANNFVLGGSASNIAGNGIDNVATGDPTSASNTIGNVTIVGNAIAGIDGDGVNLNTIRGLTIQDNYVSATGLAPAIGDDGFDLSDVTYAAAVSGNTIVGAFDDGMILDNSVLAAADPADPQNFVSVVGNTVDEVGGDGIEANGFRTVTVDGNSIGTSGVGPLLNGILVRNTVETVLVLGNTVANTGQHGIYVHDTGGQVTVGADSATGNTIDNAGLNGIYVSNTGVNGGAGGVLASHNQIAQAGYVGGASNSVGPLGGNGIFIVDTLAGDVTVRHNLIGNAALPGVVFNGSAYDGDGIFILNSAANVSVHDNSVVNAEDDGIVVLNAGLAVTVADNTIAAVGDGTLAGDGILVSNTGTVGAADDLNGDVVVSGNHVDTVEGDGSADEDDGLSSGDGIRVSNVDGNITVGSNSLQTIGNDGIQAYGIGGTALVEGNTLDSIGVFSNTGDGIVIENTGKYAASGGVAQGGSVTIIANAISNVESDAQDDSDLLSAGASQGLSTGDGIRVGAIDGEVLIGGTSTTGNTIQNVAGDGIQVYYATGEDGVDNAGIAVGFNRIVSAGAFGADADADGIQVSKTGRFGGSSADFTGNVSVFDNTVNDVQADTVDQDDGFTAGDGIRVVQADGHVTVSGNLVGAGSDATVGGIANDGIQIHTVTRSVLASGNEVGTGATIGTDQDDADGIVIESTGTLSGAAHAVAGEGDVVVASNTVANVAGDGLDDRDLATVAVNGIDAGLTAGDGIRVGFADGQVTVGGSSSTGNTVTNVGDDGIQVFAVTGNGTAADAYAVSVTDNVVTTAGVAAVNGDGIAISFTGAFATDPGGATADFNGSVLAARNTVNDVTSDGTTDEDDDRIAGDGIRVRSADGDVAILSNTIASTLGGDIDNDGIQVWDVTRAVTVSSNLVGSANASIGVGTAGTSDGDGIVVENTGFFSSYGADTANVSFGGHVTVADNVVRNVVGPADIDADGYNANGGPGASLPDIVAGNAPEEFLSAGDGIRVAYADGQVTVSGNSVDTTAGDGIQAYYVSGLNSDGAIAVAILNNTVASVGNTPSLANADGDGIVVSFTGGFGLGLAPDVGTNTGGGGVLIQGNTVDGVAGNGFDRDDGRTAGDGVRVRSANGAVTVSGNSIGVTANIANDGIQVADVTHGVTVDGNTIGDAATTIGSASVDGDGIVVEDTGQYASGGTSFAPTAGLAGVTISNNLVVNVAGDGTLDRDGPVAQFSAGDGIRATRIDGGMTADANSLTDLGDDGIQADTVAGGVTVSNNEIVGAGAASGTADGIVIADVGNAYDGGIGPSGVTVVVADNVISDVDGDGAADPDDPQHSNGDGIRIVRVDGSVQVLRTSIARVDDDGIYIGAIRQSVLVQGNSLDSVGLDSDTGDGIVVALTGTFSGGAAGGGSVTILSNTVTNVNSLSPGAPDFDNPLNFYGDTTLGLSSGDGIRAENIDGDLVIGDASATGNSIFNAEDDGIQVQTVRGSVTALFNRIGTVGVGTNAGDGIIVADVGAAYAGGTAAGVLVNVSNNTIVSVNGNGGADLDDPQHSRGDGVRIVRVDGSAQANTNTIDGVSDDGIYIGAIYGSVNVRDNRLNDMGNGSDTGDGIVVALTGAFTGGAAGGGDVTILNNTVTNVNSLTPGSADFDDPNGFYTTTGAGLSSGDGIRAENIDGDLVIGDASATGNSIFNTEDDGIQVQTVRGSVTALFNRISTVGVGTDAGDGIIVADVGAAYAGGTVAGVLVNVSNNTILSVNGDGTADLNDPNHSNGDGVRIVRVDGSAQADANTITGVDDDGIYVGVVRGSVNVRDNRLTDMGLDSATGDGIVVALTGGYANGASGAGDVTILNNTVTNVNADTPGAPDFDNPLNFYGSTGLGLSSGDGIRANQIGGDLVIGDASATGNSILNADDDGVQVQTVHGDVTALYNSIGTVGVGSNAGDGITVADVGSAYAEGGDGDVLVNVSSNTILGVNGNGTADLNDPNHSNGDGIRIVRVDGSVQANANSIASVDDDGIYVGVVRGSVTVSGNRLDGIGLDSATGDGIVVSLTGQYTGAPDGGDVTVNGNSIANVDAGTPGLDDFDNPGSFYGATGAGLSAGDGIRVEFAAGNVIVGQSAAGNSIQGVDDDGIQVYSVTGATTVTFNTIRDVANDGTDSAGGDGIQVNFTGQYAVSGLGALGAGDVVVSDNSIANVQNTSAPALDDPEDGQTAGDGIRLHQISGDATVSGNVIDPIADDGIQMGNVDFTATANDNTITDVGFTSATGDGILIFNTGMAAGDGNGSVTVDGNVITNVAINSGGVGAADPDDGGYTSNDGIRIVLVDGSAAVGSNDVTNARDDGIQVFDVRNAVNVTGNTIQTVGAGSNRGDGIVVHGTGASATVAGAAGTGGVTVSGNTVANVTGNGTLDADDGITAGDGVRLSSIDGPAVVAGNDIQTVGDDGIQAFTITGSVSVTANRVSLAGNISEGGDGIVVEAIGTDSSDAVVVSGNTVADIRGTGGVANVDNGGPTTENDGIRITNVIVGSTTVEGNDVSVVADDGIEIAANLGASNVTISGNVLNTIGTGAAGLGDGIFVTDIVIGNATISGNTISNVVSANAGAADNVDGYSAGDGIRISSMPVNVRVENNTVGGIADDGIQVSFVGGAVSVVSNSISSVSSVSTTGDGIVIIQVAANTTISGNSISGVFGEGAFDPDGASRSAGDGIRVELGTGELTIAGNSIQNVGDDGIQVDQNGDHVIALNNRIDDFGNLSAGAGDGIVIADSSSGNVTVNGNSISNGNGSAADLDDAQVAGDGIRIARSTGSVEASGNAVTGVAHVAISITSTAGGVTASGNTLASNGTGDATDAGIFLRDFASAAVTNNTIMNVTPGSLGIGIDIGNAAGPAALITLTGNSISDSGTGLFIRDNVMGTVTGNTFANNVVWGVQIDNGVSGNGIGQGIAGDPVPTLDIWFRDNVLSGNGAPAPGDGVNRGGINNLRPGPNAGGFIFDARGNDFGGQIPFTTGTHFETANSGGLGDAVSDWVRVEIVTPPPLAPVIPYYAFGSLLDSLARGGDAETPGDVLATGPYFNENGNLFDPYFVDVFSTAFGLAGDATQAGETSQYAMCYLADMWKPSSCRKAPSGGN